MDMTLARLDLDVAVKDLNRFLNRTSHTAVGRLASRLSASIHFIVISIREPVAIPVFSNFCSSRRDQEQVAYIKSSPVNKRTLLFANHKKKSKFIARCLAVHMRLFI